MLPPVRLSTCSASPARRSPTSILALLVPLHLASCPIAASLRSQQIKRERSLPGQRPARLRLPVTFRKKLTARESQRNLSRFLVTTPPESARSWAQSAPTSLRSLLLQPVSPRPPSSAGSILPRRLVSDSPCRTGSSLLLAVGVVREITIRTSPQTCLAISVQSCGEIPRASISPKRRALRITMSSVPCKRLVCSGLKTLSCRDSTGRLGLPL